MPRAMKVCAQHGCATPTAKSYCTEHTRQRDKARGTNKQRGYGREHVQLREQLRPLVEAGKAICCRCNKPIAPGSSWHLDHDDHDRSQYKGAAHALCNLSAAGKRSHVFD